MRWRYSFHRIERSCCVYQPRHTAPNERVRALRICYERSKEQADETGNHPSAWVSYTFCSLNAYKAADFALLREDGSRFISKLTPRCRSPPVRII